MFRFRRYPIINFCKGFWGFDWHYYKPFVGRNVNIYGWVPVLSFKKELRKGTLFMKEFDGFYHICRLVSVRWEDDPTDMFFAKAKWCYKKKHFSKYELEFIQRYLPKEVGESIE